MTGPPARDGAELVHRETSGAVATITLDSPHNRNALSARLAAQLSDHLAAAVSDEAVRVVVLRHTGPVFCSGMDLREASARGAGVPSAPAGTGSGGGLGALAAILETICTCPKPVIARVGGPARAGGVGLLAACDIAVAAETATFAFTEVRIGVVPAVISATVLPRLAAPAARELFLTGETFDAHRACRIGLVDAAVAADRLDDEVARYAGMLLRGAPQAIAATKRLLRRPPTGDLAEQLATLLELSARHFASTEAAEGLAAFAAKRPPRWSSG